MKEETISHPRPFDAPDEAVARREAEAILKRLPADARDRIRALTKWQGNCRASRRATAAIVRRALKKVDRNIARASLRERQKAERDVDAIARFAKRVARGNFARIPGMSDARLNDLRETSHFFRESYP